MRYLRVGLGALGAGVVVAAVVASALSASSVNPSELMAIAMTIRANESTNAATGQASATLALLTGRALEQERGILDHVAQLVANGDDYPGAMTLSEPKVLAVYGSGDQRTLDVQWHEKLANMKDGRVVDFSEATVIWHYVFVRQDGSWKVAEAEPEFAPGSGP